MSIMSEAFNARLVTSLTELASGSSDDEWRASHRVNEAAFKAIAGNGPMPRGKRVEAARRAACVELVFWVPGSQPMPLGSGDSVRRRVSKLARLARDTEWHARRGIRIGRKVAWRVLGLPSPRAYREFRDRHIRHERAAGRRFSGSAHRESPTCERWLLAQPREYRAQAQGPAANWGAVQA